MAQALFYHLTETGLAEALPVLVEKCRERDWRVVIQANNAERRDALDTQLWTFKRDAFLAHGRDGDEPASMHPIYLTISDENANGATVRFLVDGAEPPPDLSGYDRLMVMFDGKDADAVEVARRQWTLLKQSDHALTYYKQTQDGRWEKAA